MGIFSPTSVRGSLARLALGAAAAALGGGTAFLVAAARVTAHEVLHPRRWRLDEQWPGVRFDPALDAPGDLPVSVCRVPNGLRVVGPRCRGGEIDSPAPFAVGDVIVAADGVSADPLNSEQFAAAVHGRPAGSRVTFEVDRVTSDGLKRFVIPAPLSPVVRTPADLGLPFVEVGATASDGRHVTGWFIPPRGPGRAPVIAFLHGRQSNRAHIGLCDLAPRAWQRGYGLLLLDLFGCGESDGAIDLWSAEEIRLGLEILRRRSDVDPERIALVGYSYGAYKAMLAAGRAETRPAATVVIAPSDARPVHVRLLVPPEGYPAFIRRRLQRGMTPPRLLIAVGRPLVRLWIRRLAGHDLREVDPIRAAAGVGGPVLMIHGTEDRTFTPDLARAAFAALPDPKEMIWLDGHDHSSVSRAGDELWQPVLAYLDRHLHPTTGNGHHPVPASLDGLALIGGSLTPERQLSAGK